MKGTKEQRGITLIALIITIVVLLILAGVAISSIQENGILGYAQNAADSWNQAQTNEQDTLSGYVDWLKYQTCSHTYVNGVCSNCGYSPCTEGHTVVEWTVTKEATCITKTDGSQTGVCSVCGETVIETVYYKHVVDSDGACTNCNVNVVDDCEHKMIEGTWEYVERTKHILRGYCVHCGEYDDHYAFGPVEDHTTLMCGEMCTVCLAEMDHDFMEETDIDGNVLGYRCYYCDDLVSNLE